MAEVITLYSTRIAPPAEDGLEKVAIPGVIEWRKSDDTVTVSGWAIPNGILIDYECTGNNTVHHLAFPEAQQLVAMAVLSEDSATGTEKIVVLRLIFIDRDETHHELGRVTRLSISHSNRYTAFLTHWKLSALLYLPT